MHMFSFLVKLVKLGQTLPTQGVKTCYLTSFLVFVGLAYVCFSVGYVLHLLTQVIVYRSENYNLLLACRLRFTFGSVFFSRFFTRQHVFNL